MKKFTFILCLITVLVSFSACKKETAKKVLKDGEYEGITSGFNDKDVTATITIDKGVLTAVTIDTSNETADVGEPVGEKIAAAVLAKGSTEGVEIVAQATVSSTAAIEAVNKALAKAK